MTICKYCGAQNKSNTICIYCGSLLKSVDSVRDELAAINELHLHVADGDDSTQKRILLNGYIPSTEDALIEAGVRCIPLISLRDPYSEQSKSAMQRLSAISTRLRIMETNDRITRTLHEFESILSRWEKVDSSNAFWGFTMIGVFITGIGVLIWYLFFR